MRVLTSLLMIAIACITPIASFVDYMEFEQKCGSYLKNAADANTPEIALERVNKALDYIETKGLTKGYTSIFYNTEDENIGFWYQNIKACQDELAKCLDGTQLEKSNVLMKVRESLTDNGDSGTELTVPDGIYKYPNNKVYAVFWVMSVIVGGIGLLRIND